MKDEEGVSIVSPIVIGIVATAILLVILNFYIPELGALITLHVFIGIVFTSALQMTKKLEEELTPVLTSAGLKWPQYEHVDPEAWNKVHKIYIILFLLGPLAAVQQAREFVYQTMLRK